MAHKITYDQLAQQVARTQAALPNADWNEPKPKLPLEDRTTAEKFIAAGQPARQKLPLEDPVIAAKFVAAKQEAAPERRARATWGPDALGEKPRLVYAPRWKTDHHPWLVAGSSIRYAGHEVEEVDSAAETRHKVEALDAELRRSDLDPSLRAALIAERTKLVAS